MATLKNTTINDTGYIQLPSGTTGERPASPTNGMMRYNTTTTNIETYTSVGWVNITSGPWSLQRPITITSTPGTDWQVRIQLTTANFSYTNTNANGSDLRFGATSGFNPSTSSFNHWIESWNPTGTSIIWVKVPTSATTTIYMRYKNPDASAVSSITSTLASGWRCLYYGGTGFNTLDFYVADTYGPYYNWGGGTCQVMSQGSRADSLSIQWDAWVIPTSTGTMTFRVTTDDGARTYSRALSSNSWVNRIDSWRDQGPTTYTGTAAGIVSGTPIQVLNQWYENGGGATALFDFAWPGAGYTTPPGPAYHAKYGTGYTDPYAHNGTVGAESSV